MRTFYLLLFYLILIGCASINTHVKPALQTKGKKIGMGTFEITLQKKGKKYNADTVCTCIAESIETALIPYLNTAGFSVFKPELGKNYSTSLIKTASTPNIEVEYVLKGTGMIHNTGSSYFVDQLSIELQDIKNGEVLISTSFIGFASYPIKAAQKIGKDLLKKMK